MSKKASMRLIEYCLVYLITQIYLNIAIQWILDIMVALRKRLGMPWTRHHWPWANHPLHASPSQSILAAFGLTNSLEEWSLLAFSIQSEVEVRELLHTILDRREAAQGFVGGGGCGCTGAACPGLSAWLLAVNRRRSRWLIKVAVYVALRQNRSCLVYMFQQSQAVKN